MQEPNKDQVTIFVDGDACPVKDEIMTISVRHSLDMFLVSNAWLRMEVAPNVHKIVVSEGADEADNWIAERIGTKGICITADIPLAKRCLDAGGTALGPTGRVFTDHSIGMAMAMRELNQHLRETGESKGYNAAFTGKDRSEFKQSLEREIQRLKRLA